MEQTFGSGHVELTRFTKCLKLGSYHNGLGDYYDRTLVMVVTGVLQARQGGGGGGEDIQRLQGSFDTMLCTAKVEQSLGIV